MSSLTLRVDRLESSAILGGNIEAFEAWLRTISDAELRYLANGGPLPTRFSPLEQTHAPDSEYSRREAGGPNPGG